MRILAVTIGGLGDAILFTPVIKALHYRYPKAELELLLASKLGAVAFSNANEINHITCVNINKAFLLAKVIALIPFSISSRMKSGFDLGVFATGLNPHLSIFLKIAAGIRKVVYASKPPICHTDLSCNLELARQFNPNISEKDVFLPLTDAYFSEAETLLDQYNLSWKNDRIIAIYPSTNLWHRPRWELKNLIGVARQIKDNGFEGKIVVVGSQEEGKEWEKEDTESVADAILAGDLSILGTAALLSRCCLTLGNDGGLVHVAGAVGCPLVVVMTNTPLSYKPPGENTKVIHSKMDCCDSLYPNRPKSCKFALCKEDIPLEQVVQKSMEFLP